MSNRLTLANIGEIAGVSSATVSRVLNNRRGVRPEIRARVWQVIDETGYQPNAAARSLAGQGTQLIGLIIPETANILFTDPYFPRLIQGIAACCKRHDYLLSLFLFHAVEDERKLSSQVLQASLLDGIIITATQTGDPLINQLIESEMPFVQIGQHDDPRVNYVDADNYAGAYTAVTHLIRLGYQRIAHISGPLNNLAALQRRDGYLHALRDRGRPVDPALTATADFTEPGGFEAMVRLLPQEPDAVFAGSDTMALGALRALRQADLAIPDDIALVGYDDLPPARSAEPSLTTIRQPVKRAGEIAVETLIDVIHHGSDPARRIILPTELVVRASCGASMKR